MDSPLLKLNRNEWEALCDGCGRCCLVKLEDEDTGEIHYTNVACGHFITDTCRCSDYRNRARINTRCIILSKDNLDTLKLMPFTCAYRLVHEGRTIDQEKHELSVRGRVVSEQYIHDEQLPDHIADWVYNGNFDNR
jgi:uncharacterized cysteine cluster protein YcgN (CxxCxxCC family)